MPIQKTDESMLTWNRGFDDENSKLFDLFNSLEDLSKRKVSEAEVSKVLNELVKTYDILCRKEFMMMEDNSYWNLPLAQMIYSTSQNELRRIQTRIVARWQKLTRETVEQIKELIKNKIWVLKQFQKNIITTKSRVNTILENE